MLAGFPAGLVIYWAWNNSLSVAQQSAIMRKPGRSAKYITLNRITLRSFPHKRQSSSGSPLSRGRTEENAARLAFQRKLISL